MMTATAEFCVTRIDHSIQYHCHRCEKREPLPPAAAERLALLLTGVRLSHRVCLRTLDAPSPLGPCPTSGDLASALQVVGAEFLAAALGGEYSPSFPRLDCLDELLQEYERVRPAEDAADPRRRALLSESQDLLTLLRAALRPLREVGCDG